MNLGKKSSESAFSVLKLSTVLSAYVDYQEIKRFDSKLKCVLIQSLRRSLTFTLIRNYELSKHVWSDLISKVLLHKNSRIKVTKALLKVKRLLKNKYSLHNVAFIDPMIEWTYN